MSTCYAAEPLSAVNEGAILGKEGYVEYMISDKGAGDRTVISKAVAILMTYLGGAFRTV